MKELFIGLTVWSFAFAQTISAADWYVATNGTGDGTNNWANATNNIQGAIDASLANDTVWVSNGVYEVGGQTNYPSSAVLTNRVAIYKAITVRSANNDPANTIIKGAWASDGNTNGVDAVRCVYMTNGSALIGFMITNGATFLYSGPPATTNHRGGGVWSQSTNTVISNCVIAGNAAGYEGGGACYGTLYNCTLIGNKQGIGNGGGGGGAAYGTLYDCTLTGNSGYSGGAMNSTLSNCVLNGNSGGAGGGARSCTMYNCTIVSNSQTGISGVGGGVYQGNLYNCTLSGNSALATASSKGGGGAYGANLYNCLIVSNSASRDGGGAYDGALYNCTIVSNSAANAGGGVRGSILYNCISWSNKTVDYQPAAYYSCGVGYTNGGSVSGNITNNPLFVDFAAGNFRLSRDSPCINTGTNQSWMTNSVDLDGRGRIRYGTVDMGAYEYIYEGTIYSSR